MKERRISLAPAAATVAVAACLWFVTFYLSWSVFWIKISFSAALLAGLSLRLEPEILGRLKIDGAALIIGLVSAILLYLIFWLGKNVSVVLFPFARHQIGSIYGKGQGTHMGVIALLLFFITGPCEEIYWRGYLQHNLARRFGPWRGWLLATACYAGVHIASLNFMLIGAAAVAGAFWGLLYQRLGKLAPVIVSHSIWSTVVFAVLPIP